MNRLVAGIFLVLVLSTLALTINTQKVRARTIIVPDNYGTIQEAVNSASAGDTVYVRSGVYYEKQVTITKPLKLVGQNKSTTFIDGNKSWVCIYVQNTYNVEIHGFTVRNGYGIYLSYCHNVTISDDIISGNGQGINFINSTNNIIQQNLVTQNDAICILLGGSDNNLMVKNFITENHGDAVWVEQGKGNIIRENNITRNGLGTAPGYHVYGVRLSYSRNNRVYHNNIIDNFEQANGWQSVNNAWDDGFPSGGNYWSNYNGTDGDNDGIGDTPYVIDTNNVDRYPLMKPWPAIPSGVPERKVGVKVGDWAIYDFVANYTTNDPNPPMPSPSPDIANIEYYKASVLSVKATNITFQLVIHFKNGTDISVILWIDVDSSSSMGMPLFIAANLSAGDKLFPSQYSPRINATIMRTYAGAEREVNLYGLRQNTTSPLGYKSTAELDMYWDRASGIFDEFIEDMQFTKISEGYVTHIFMRLVMRETNIWSGRTIAIIDAQTGLNFVTLQKGSSFTVNVTLNGVTDYLHGFQVAIAFDNTKIKCTAAWINRNDPNFVFYNATFLMSFVTIHNSLGCLAVGSAVGIDFVIPDHQLLRYANVTGQKLLCQINFTAIAVGNSSLQFITNQPSPCGYITALFNASKTMLTFGTKDFSVITTLGKIRTKVFITPVVLNLKSHGRWITAYIMLPKGCSVDDVDLSSIKLNGTISAERVHVIESKVPIIIVKFDRQAVIDLIMHMHPSGKGHVFKVTLTISGNLTDGTTFQGSGKIWVLWKTPKHGNNP